MKFSDFVNKVSTHTVTKTHVFISPKQKSKQKTNLNNFPLCMSWVVLLLFGPHFYVMGTFVTHTLTKKITNTYVPYLVGAFCTHSLKMKNINVLNILAAFTTHTLNIKKKHEHSQCHQ